jgi:NADH-quinone oxidoreductase subunit G
MGGTLIATAPGGEAAALDALHDDESLRQPGAVILVGERLATATGGYSAALRLARATGARVGWVPRRAGDRGALEAGAAPNLLPGGRPVDDPDARAEVAAAWNVDELPTAQGRDASSIFEAAADGALGALLIGGVELDDLPDPAAALAALDGAGAKPFVVSLELRHSAVTDRADVVFPVATVTEKAGTFVNWEGRSRPFAPALPPTATSDARVLAALAEEVGVDLGLGDAAAVRDELGRLGTWQGPRAADPDVSGQAPAVPAAGQAVLAGWRMLLDAGRLQDGEPHLAGTARPSVVRLSPATAAEIGVSDDDRVTVGSGHGEVTLPLEITDMPDRVVWLPLNSHGSTVAATLRVSVGAVVDVRGGDQK